MNRNKVTVAAINKALAKAGPERLRRGHGHYFYFYGGKSAEWPVTAVYVNWVGALSIEEWVEQRNLLSNYKSLI